MLREQLINQEVPPSFSKNKKYILSLIAIVFMALIFAYYSVSHHSASVEHKHISSDDKLVQWGRDIKNRFYPCPKRHKIAYIWSFGDMPEIYKDFMNRCKDNIILLNATHVERYIKMWNAKHPQNAINNVQKIARNTRNDFLKRIYLYFEAGIYADFDTQINEECWQDVVTDKILFTNTWGGYGSYSLPEENFMKVEKPFNLYLKQWIVQLIYETHWMGNRWDRCRWEQCLILSCQQHNYDNSWVVNNN